MMYNIGNVCNDPHHNKCTGHYIIYSIIANIIPKFGYFVNHNYQVNQKNVV